MSWELISVVVNVKCGKLLWVSREWWWYHFISIHEYILWPHTSIYYDHKIERVFKFSEVWFYGLSNENSPCSFIKKHTDFGVIFPYLHCKLALQLNSQLPTFCIWFCFCFCLTFLPVGSYTYHECIQTTAYVTRINQSLISYLNSSKQWKPSIICRWYLYNIERQWHDSTCYKSRTNTYLIRNFIVSRLFSIITVNFQIHSSNNHIHRIGASVKYVNCPESWIIKLECSCHQKGRVYLDTICGTVHCAEPWIYFNNNTIADIRP